MGFFRTLLLIQAFYIFITAVWPLVHIESFMAVTGPKTDVWLVKTVGALLIPISLCMLVHWLMSIRALPVVVLGMGTSIAFICIDFYYALNDVISDIYLADGILQILFLMGWGWVLLIRKKNNSILK
jgi:hypothetical protein